MEVVVVEVVVVEVEVVVEVVVVEVEVVEVVVVKEVEVEVEVDKIKNIDPVWRKVNTRTIGSFRQRYYSICPYTTFIFLEIKRFNPIILVFYR